MAYDDTTQDAVENEEKKNLSKPQEGDNLSADLGGATVSKQTSELLKVEKGQREKDSDACCALESPGGLNVGEFLRKNNELFLSVAPIKGDFDFAKMVKDGGTQVAAKMDAVLQQAVPGDKPATTLASAAPRGESMMADGPVRPPAADDVGASIMVNGREVEGGQTLDFTPRPADRAPDFRGADRDRAAHPNERPLRPGQTERFDANDTHDRVVDRARQMGANPEQLASLERNLAKMEGKFGKDSEQMKRIYASMNDIMTSDKFKGGNADQAKLNTMLDTAAKIAEPEKAFGQGAHNTCACESQGRVLAQRDPVAYAEMMGALCRDGKAVVGDPNTPVRIRGELVSPREISINPANFVADREAGAPFDERRAFNGQRSMAGQLNDAVFGQQMANIAGARDGRRYEYVAAGVSRPPSQTGEGLFDVTTGTPQFKESCPPADVATVACMNYANKAGGLMVQENMARQFQLPDGTYPPGMVVFKDAADLREKLKALPKDAQGRSPEMQIVTNGTMVAGMDGHGLHAQGVLVNERGELQFRNNWTAQHNDRVYSENFVNAFTNPQMWGQGYRPAPGDRVLPGPGGAPAGPGDAGPGGVPPRPGDAGPAPAEQPRDFRREVMDNDREAQERANRDAARRVDMERREQEMAKLAKEREALEKKQPRTADEEKRLKEIKEQEAKLKEKQESDKKEQEKSDKQREKEEAEKKARHQLQEKELKDQELAKREKELGSKKNPNAAEQKDLDQVRKDRKELFTPTEQKYRDWQRQLLDVQNKGPKDLKEYIKKMADLLNAEPKLAN